VTIYYYSSPTPSITFDSVTADGSATQTTTKLTLTFSGNVSSLSASDITLTGVSGITKGTPTSTGTLGEYTMNISGFTSGGTLTVAVSNSEVITGASKTVTIYYYSSPTPTGTVTLSWDSVHGKLTSSPSSVAIGSSTNRPTVTFTIPASIISGTNTIAWYVDGQSVPMTGPTTSGTNSSYTYSGFNTKGDHTVNVLAMIDGVLYSATTTVVITANP